MGALFCSVKFVCMFGHLCEVKVLNRWIFKRNLEKVALLLDR